MTWAFSFLQRYCQRWQSPLWRKLGASCPYHTQHANQHKKHQLGFVQQRWFNLYASNTLDRSRRGHYAKRTKYRLAGDSCRREYRHAKLYKLYWFLHPQEHSA